MKKINLIYVLILLLTFGVEAKTENFVNNIIVNTYYTTNNETNITSAQVNITTEQDTHIFNCLINSTNSFLFTLHRNVSDNINIDSLTSTFNNFTGNVNSMISTCNDITKQYGDINTYYKLYVNSNTENELCKKDKQDQLNKIAELGNAKNEYTTCTQNLNQLNNDLSKYSNQISMLQGNLTSISQDLQKANNGKFLWAIGAFIIMGIIIIVKDRKKNPTLQRHKTLGLSGGTQR